MTRSIIFEAIVRGVVGTHGYTRFNGTVNFPLAPRLSARATYSCNNKEGFSRNETLGRKVADQESHVVRGKIKYEGDAFDIVLSGDYNKITGHEQLIQLAAYNPAVFSEIGRASCRERVCQYV